jgi:hypothetical protein
MCSVSARLLVGSVLHQLWKTFGCQHAVHAHFYWMPCAGAYYECRCAHQGGQKHPYYALRMLFN